MICLDSTFLGLLIHPNSKAPADPGTGLPIERLADRLKFIQEVWSTDREIVVIPTPVLCEFLILAGKEGPKYLSLIENTSNFRIVSFDALAAIELAAMQSETVKNKRADTIGTWAKIKFDRQIVAIAKVTGASAIYSDDENLGKFAQKAGISVVNTWKLALPPEAPPELPFPEPYSEDSAEILHKLLSNVPENDPGDNKS